MQGFNKYYPPDYDPKTAPTLNAYRGIHALGARAKDIDKGILVVRFELPYNVWCGTCGKHIGAGVRYNAQKRKVGHYYSTPIFAFRCKCHLCDGWFEIRTDPKVGRGQQSAVQRATLMPISYVQNAAYVVHEGAKAQAQDWDPLDNGGYRPTGGCRSSAGQSRPSGPAKSSQLPHPADSEAPSAAEAALADPFAHLEKATTQRAVAASNVTRLSALTALSHRQTSDPYTMSQHARARFRAAKAVDQARKRADEAVCARAGLGVQLAPEVEGEGRDDWARTAGARRGRRAAPGARVDVEALAVKARRNTLRKMDLFEGAPGAVSGAARTTLARGVHVKSAGGSRRHSGSSASTTMTAEAATPRATGLVDYGSDSD